MYVFLCAKGLDLVSSWDTIMHCCCCVLPHCMAPSPQTHLLTSLGVPKWGMSLFQCHSILKSSHQILLPSKVRAVCPETG